MSKDTKKILAIAEALTKIGTELVNFSKIIAEESKEEVTPSKPKAKAKAKTQSKSKASKAKAKAKAVVPDTNDTNDTKKSSKKDKSVKKKLVKKTKEPTVLDRVFKVIKRSRKGATVEKIKEATQLDKKQISNSLYKLTKKNMVKTISRGVYVPIED